MKRMRLYQGDLIARRDDEPLPAEREDTFVDCSEFARQVGMSVDQVRHAAYHQEIRGSTWKHSNGQGRRKMQRSTLRLRVSEIPRVRARYAEVMAERARRIERDKQAMGSQTPVLTEPPCEACVRPPLSNEEVVVAAICSIRGHITQIAAMHDDIARIAEATEKLLRVWTEPASGEKPRDLRGLH